MPVGVARLQLTKTKRAPRPEPFSVEAWNDPGCERTMLLGGERHAKSGGSHELHLYDHGRAIFVCHRNLQSAGNASWPLHCRARQFWRTLLSGIRRGSSAL